MLQEGDAYTIGDTIDSQRFYDVAKMEGSAATYKTIWDSKLRADLNSAITQEHGLSLQLVS